MVSADCAALARLAAPLDGLPGTLAPLLLRARQCDSLLAEPAADRRPLSCKGWRACSMACNAALSATTQAFRHNGKFPMAYSAPSSPETIAYSTVLRLFPATHSPDEPFISLGTVLMLFKAQQVSAAPGVESSRKLARLASDQISPFGPLIHCLQVTCDGRNAQARHENTAQNAGP